MPKVSDGTFVKCQGRKIYRVACRLHSQGLSVSAFPVDDACVGCTWWEGGYKPDWAGKRRSPNKKDIKRMQIEEVE